MFYMYVTHYKDFYVNKYEDPEAANLNTLITQETEGNFTSNHDLRTTKRESS